MYLKSVQHCLKDNLKYEFHQCNYIQKYIITLKSMTTVFQKSEKIC